MLDTFGVQQGGTQYRRLIASFQRIFGATIFFGTDIQRDKAAVFHQARFNFMSEARIWYSRDHQQETLPGGCQNEIVLSAEFYREVMEHPIPADLDAAKALSSFPAALDLFMWVSYRCFTAKGEERVPLFGEFGLVSQLGSGEYRRPRKFRECLENWLGLVKTLWPSCPARISEDGMRLIVAPGALRPNSAEPRPEREASASSEGSSTLVRPSPSTTSTQECATSVIPTIQPRSTAASKPASTRRSHSTVDMVSQLPTPRACASYGSRLRPSAR